MSKLKGAVMDLRPSKAMWDYYFEASWKRKEITPLSVCSAIADLSAGQHISYTASEVLKDLGLLTTNSKPNKKAKRVLAHYLHSKFHGSIPPLRVVSPVEIEDPETVIKLCPFCGGKPIKGFTGPDKRFAFVRCIDCDAGTAGWHNAKYGQHMKSAMNHWNTRADPELTAARVVVEASRHHIEFGYSSRLFADLDNAVDKYDKVKDQL